MKTIFKSTILLTVGLAAALTSCKDDKESNPTLAQPTSFVLNEPAITGNIDLEKTPSVELTWSQPTPYNNFNTPMVPTYTVQLSTAGSFNTAYDANLEDNSGADYIALDETYNSGQSVSITSETINRALITLNGWDEESKVPETQNISVRVKSAIRDASFREYATIFSNVITLKTAPYYVELKPADPQIWWLIGADIADGSWGGDMGKCVIPMQTISGAEYDKKEGLGEIQWTGYLAGSGFKLKETLDSWDHQWGQGDSFGTFVKNDGGSSNISVPEAGLYTVTLNTATDKLIVEPFTGTAPVFDGMAISGSFNEWGDTPMEPCSSAWENHDWYISYDLAAGDEIKVKQAGSWDFNKGGTLIPTADGMYAYGESGGANFVITESATYMILFNDITGYVRFIKQ